MHRAARGAHTRAAATCACRARGCGAPGMRAGAGACEGGASRGDTKDAWPRAALPVPGAPRHSPAANRAPAAAARVGRDSGAGGAQKIRVPCLLLAPKGRGIKGRGVGRPRRAVQAAARDGAGPAGRQAAAPRNHGGAAQARWVRGNRVGFSPGAAQGLSHRVLVQGIGARTGIAGVAAHAHGRTGRRAPAAPRAQSGGGAARGPHGRMPRAGRAHLPDTSSTAPLAGGIARL